jgi:DNA-binding PadR family transcriptional regulator
MTDAIGSTRNIEASRRLAAALLAHPKAQHYRLDLEHTTGLSPTRLTPALGRFKRAGWIDVGTIGERWARRQFYTLTKKGKQELPAIRDLGKNGAEPHAIDEGRGETKPDPATAVVAALEEKRAEVEELFKHSLDLNEYAGATPEERSEAELAYMDAQLELLQDLDREGLQLSAEGLDALVWFEPQQSLTLDQRYEAEMLVRNQSTGLEL